MALEVLSPKDVAFFQEHGYLVLPDQIPMDRINAIRGEIDKAMEVAKTLTESTDQLDLETTHTPDDPRLRRIKLPHTHNDVMRDLMYSDHVLAPARDLIGPDLRLHTSKLNMKSAGFGGGQH